jgi:hypothetical protein
MTEDQNRDDRGPKNMEDHMRKKINKWKTKLGLENSEGS